MLKIDGSGGEGGGQILRNATALAAITGKGVAVDNIRAGRKKPGLSPQHLSGLQLLANITHGQLEGGAVRSSKISFAPGLPPHAAGSFEADTQTAGSCTLLVQQALPVLLFAAGGTDGGQQQQEDRAHKRLKGDGSSSHAPNAAATSHLTLKGGTDASFAPPIGYLQHVFLPTLQRLIAPWGTGLSLDLQRRGFFPKGGGVVQLTVPALPPDTPLPAWNLTNRGHLVRIRGWAVVAGKLRAEIAQRMASSATQALRAALDDPAVLFGAAGASSSSRRGSGDLMQAAGGSTAQQQQRGPAATNSDSSVPPSILPSVVLDIVAQHEPPERAVGDGGSIVLVAETSTGCLLGASALTERGVSAEAVGAMAARDLLEELRSGAAVDSWLQDQLVIFMALAGGTSSMLCGELTLHTRTAISIAEQLLPLTADGGGAGARRLTVVAVPTGSTTDGGGQQSSLYTVTCAGAGCR